MDYCSLVKLLGIEILVGDWGQSIWTSLLPILRLTIDFSLQARALHNFISSMHCLFFCFVTFAMHGHSSYVLRGKIWLPCHYNYDAKCMLSIAYSMHIKLDA